MAMKIMLIKSTFDGEQLSVEWNLEKRDYDRLEKGETLREILAPFLRFTDDRLREMNLRIMVSQKCVKTLPVEAQMAFHNVMDTLHGMKPQDLEWIQVVKDAAKETAEHLIQQGVSPEQVKQSFNDSFGKEVADVVRVPEGEAK